MRRLIAGAAISLGVIAVALGLVALLLVALVAFNVG